MLHKRKKEIKTIDSKQTPSMTFFTKLEKKNNLRKHFGSTNGRSRYMKEMAPG